MGEFNSTFLARIQEGLQSAQIIARIKEINNVASENNKLELIVEQLQQTKSMPQPDVEMLNMSAIPFLNDPVK